MTDEMKTPTGGRMICCYADQGAGKTSLIATAPLNFRVHVIDIDNGLEPARQAWLNRGGHPDNLSYIDGISDYTKLHAAMWTLPNDKDLYIIDTYTTAMKLFKAYVMKGKIEVTNWMKVGGQVSGLAIDYFDHFRTQVMRKGAWGLVLCQDKLKTISEGVERLCPDLVGAAGRDVAGMSDFLLHCERERVMKDGKADWRRVLRTQEAPTVMAKDRSGALAPLEDANLETLFAKIDVHRAKVDNLATFNNATT